MIKNKQDLLKKNDDGLEEYNIDFVSRQKQTKKVNKKKTLTKL